MVLNKKRGKSFELSINDIEELADVPVLAVLKDDNKVLEALSETTPVSLYAPRSNAGIEFRKLAATLIGETYEEPGIWAKIKGMFGSKYAKEEINRTIFHKDRIKI